MRQITRGAAANAGLIFHVFVMDSASTAGAGKASVAYSSFACRYIRNGEAISGAITPEDISTIGTYAAPTANTNIRIKAVDNTNMIGVYEVQIHADWVNTTNTCQSLTIYLTATGVAVLPLQIPLIAANMQDTVRLGLTALPNAAAEAAGGLFTRGTGAGQINQAANGMIDTNPVRLNNVSQSLLDLKDFADDGYDPSTNKVQGVVLADTVTTLTNLPAITTNWLTAAGIAAGALNGKGDWNIGKTGYALSTAGVQAIWDALTSALTTAGSIGKKLADWVIGTSQTGDAYAIVNSGTFGNAAIKTDLDKVPKSDGSVIFNPTAVGNIKSGLSTQAELDKVPKSDGAVSWNTTALAAIQGEATDALNAYDPSTNTETVGYVAAILAKLLAYFQIALRSDADVGVQLAADVAALNANLGGGAVGTYLNPSHSQQAIRARGDTAWITATGFSTFNPAVDVVAHVTLVDTTTTNTDMRGTDNAALATELAKVPKSDSNVTFNTTALASIKAQAVAALATDTYAEPGQGDPPATTTLANKIGYNYKWTLNKKDNDGTTTQFYNNAGAVVDQKQPTSEAAGTVTKGKIVTGP